jgi:membrane associated rhomboid family serine protease
MSWYNRPYANDEPYREGGGLRSWFGGMPSPGRAVKRLLLANITMFLLGLLTGGEGGWLYRGLEMRTDLVLKGQIWRLVTFTYLHDLSGLWHIFFNMLGLYMLGVGLEQVWGARRFFIFYTLGGFIAVSLYFLITVMGWLDPRIPLVGASGGVLAVLGACAVLFPQTRIFIYFFPIPIRTAVMLFTLFYGFNLLTRGGNAGGDACHLAGMVFGVAYGYRGEAWAWRWRSWRDSRSRHAEEARQRQVVELQSEVDRILEKVHRAGVGSLTEREKKTLQRASQDVGSR